MAEFIDSLGKLAEGIGSYGKATTSTGYNQLADANQASAPGLAIFQRGLAVDKANEEGAQKQALIQEIANRVNSKDYLGAAALYGRLDPEGLKSLIPQLMSSDPSLQGQLKLAEETNKLAPLTNAGSNARQIADANNAAEMERLKLKLAAEEKAKLSSEPQPTVLQKEVDKKFAPEIVEWDNKGGYTNIEKNLTQLDRAKKLLKEGTNVSGPLIGLIPKMGRDIIAPDSGKVQDTVQDVVMGTLRPILGAQFTEEEGKRVIANTFNERLSPKENLRRLELLQKTIKEQAKAKQASVDYAKKYGTLEGYEGPKPVSSAQELMTTIAEKAGIQTKEINGQTYQKVNGGWSLVK